MAYELIARSMEPLGLMCLAGGRSTSFDGSPAMYWDFEP